MYKHVYIHKTYKLQNTMKHTSNTKYEQTYAYTYRGTWWGSVLLHVAKAIKSGMKWTW